MNGLVVNSWPYVIASFVVTWVVLLGYSVRLLRLVRRHRASASSPSASGT